MKCPKCGEEMKKGYLFTTKDGAFSFANEVPGMLKNAKNAEGFIKITSTKLNHRASIEGYCCETCRLVQFRY